MAPALRLAERTGRGVFVLALTSNPEGAGVQHCRSREGVPVAARIVSQLADFNASCDKVHLGPAGVVVGATVGSAVADLGIDLAALRGPVLAPGVGAQGAGPAQVRDVFRGARSAVLASSSRAILESGPDLRGLRSAYKRAVTELAG